MTTTQLIELLKNNEFGGATGRPREVSFEYRGHLLYAPSIHVCGSGDGLFAELFLELKKDDDETRNADHIRSMNNCRFCENLKKSIDLLKYDKHQYPRKHNGYKDEFYAALIHRVLYNEEPAGYSESVSCSLNYCPECGRKINNDETNS